MFYKATNFLRSQSFYRKYGPNLPISLTHRVSIRPKATNLGDLMRLWVRINQKLILVHPVSRALAYASNTTETEVLYR
jgi:hypothetical protein